MQRRNFNLRSPRSLKKFQHSAQERGGFKIHRFGVGKKGNHPHCVHPQQQNQYHYIEERLFDAPAGNRRRYERKNDRQQQRVIIKRTPPLPPQQSQSCTGQTASRTGKTAEKTDKANLYFADQQPVDSERGKDKKNDPELLHSGPLRLHKFYNLGGTIKNFSNFSDFDLKNNGSGFILLQGVCGKEFLFTAAKIKATRGKGTDFYQQHLSNNDYYSEHDRVVGIWSGSLAEEFGLQGEMVDSAVFSLFQQNLNPVNHRKLTPRNNPHSVRFYDFQCSAQKSVSVMSMFDPRLAEAHRRAVKVGMAELEKFAAVRIRKGDNYATKNFAFTGKIIYAEYHYDNSRLLDPQIGQRRK